VEVASDGTFYVVSSVSGNIATPAANDNSNKPSSTAFVMAQLTGIVGSFRNLNANITAASASATWTADQVVVGTALNGVEYLLPSYSQTVNLATTGAGGMDTGAAPVSGWVAVYAIFNPTTGAQSILATTITAVAAPTIYAGAHMPAGYTASALLSVMLTNSSSLFVIGAQKDHEIYFPARTAATTSTQVSSATAVSLTAIVPPNARTFQAQINVSSNTTVQNPSTTIYAASGGPSGYNIQLAGSSNGNSVNVASFSDFPLLTPQQVWWTATMTGGTFSGGSFSVVGYTI
jgi:hypothetical protein